MKSILAAVLTVLAVAAGVCAAQTTPVVVQKTTSCATSVYGSVVGLLGMLHIPAAGNAAHAVGLVLLVIDQFFVVGLSEEFFYRGYLLTRFSEQWPPRTKLLGAPFGKAMWLQTALFALGHLLTPQAFRLGTFFPGLLFGWMAARSRRVVAPAIVHAASNLLIATLEASAFGP